MSEVEMLLLYDRRSESGMHSHYMWVHLILNREMRVTAAFESILTVLMNRSRVRGSSMFECWSILVVLTQCVHDISQHLDNRFYTLTVQSRTFTYLLLTLPLPLHNPFSVFTTLLTELALLTHIHWLAEVICGTMIFIGP